MNQQPGLRLSKASSDHLTKAAFHLSMLACNTGFAHKSAECPTGENIDLELIRFINDLFDTMLPTIVAQARVALEMETTHA